MATDPWQAPLSCAASVTKSSSFLTRPAFSNPASRWFPQLLQTAFEVAEAGFLSADELPERINRF